MTYKKLLKFCDPIIASGTIPDTVGELRQDSRAVQKNDVFIAIEGTRSDGHDFIPQAVANGASLIISEKQINIEKGTALWVVKNSRKLIGPLAQFMAGNPAEQLKIIGVTGTNGKTTVTTLIWQILTAMDYRASLLGTVEKRINQNTLQSKLTTADPIELASDMKQIAEAGSEFLVMEVSSHALHQRRVHGIHFNVAVFTNLSLDHLDYHSSMNEYASAKKLLFNSLDDSSWAVTNADDSKGEWMVNSTPARVISISFKGNGLINAEILKSGAGGMTISVDDVKINTPLVGKFNAYNVVQALLSCTSIGLDGKKVSEVIESCKGAPGRLESVTDQQAIDKNPLVLVDYAHTPNALENVLSTLKELKTKRQKLSVVFGCGGDRDRSKRPEMAAIAEKFADYIFVTSDNPRSEQPDAIIDEILGGFSDQSNVTSITSRKEAINTAIRHADKHTIVLIAGKGHETYQEINGERIHFDDREIAREALQSKNGHTNSMEVA